MSIQKLLRLLAASALTALVAACGGANEASNTTADGPAAQAELQKTSTPNYVTLKSAVGDYIGGGKSFNYTPTNAVLTVQATGAHLSVQVTGNERWRGEFQLPNSSTRLHTGSWTNVLAYPTQTPNLASMSWTGEGRGCSTLTGWLIIDRASYSDGQLIAIDLRFEQRCDGAAAALTGRIRWRANDTTVPPGPIVPAPASLWAPAASATPSTGNYVYLTSDTGDYIGQGRTSTYTQANATLALTADGGRITVNVNGNEYWSGNFQAMNTLSSMQPGYYGNLQRYPFHNPTAGGLDWGGEGRGCNTLLGWFVIDSISYADGALKAIDLRFEQHCEGGTAALRGQIHWSADDTSGPSGPMNPPPPELWAPAASATPNSGNYVYLTSDTSDYIGQGRTNTYTQANATLAVTANGGRITVNVNGSEYWTGNFQAMNTLTTVQPGYYGNLERYPFHNPTLGGLEWSGSGRGCNTLTGWFAVDKVSYTNGALNEIDLRFEQHCEGAAAAQRGKIHWSAHDTSTPGGPITPPPADLWAPAAGSTPTSGNYVYLASDIGDYIGQGRTTTYTPASIPMTVTATGNRLTVSINGSAEWWTGDFQGMNTITQLQPGYYGNLKRYPFHNATAGGLNWSGTGRGCNTLTGWFVVDSVSYNGGTLSAIDLRFEQHCEGGTPALHGKIHWVQ